MADPWGSLAGQTCLLGKLQATERSSQRPRKTAPEKITPKGTSGLHTLSSLQLEKMQGFSRALGATVGHREEPFRSWLLTWRRSHPYE